MRGCNKPVFTGNMGAEMKSIAAGPIVALALLSAAPAGAQSRDLSTLWVIVPSAPPAGERTLAGGEFVLKQRLLPLGLAELAADATLGAATLPAGTQLIEAQTEGAKVFCASEVAKQKLIGAAFQPCLVDEDGDGDFEGWFSGVSQTKGLLTLAGRRPKKPKLLGETRYTVVPPTTMRDVYFVAIERRNFFNIYSRESFMIAFGHEGQIERLTTPASFKSAEMPKELTVMGARFTALREADGKMTVRVDRAMPAQPFGVVKTTTVRFY